MKSLQSFSERFKRLPKDVTGIDIDADEVRVARIRRQSDGQATLVAADILPVPEISEAGEVEPLALPAALRGRHACIALAAPHSVVKLLTMPGYFRDDQIDRLVEGLGIEDADNYRIAYKLITEGHGRSESRVLVVATPEKEAAIGARLLPAGLPVPHSVEVSGLAAMSAFLHGPPAHHAGEGMALLHFGDETTTLALFNRGVLSLIRRLSFGQQALLKSIQDSLGIDAETAREITADGAFDISQSVSGVLAPFVKQLTVSRDFVERRENCTVTKLFTSGTLANSDDVLRAIQGSLELDVEGWNAFQSLHTPSDAIASQGEGQQLRFTAAIGAALGAFEEI